MGQNLQREGLLRMSEKFSSGTKTSEKTEQNNRIDILWDTGACGQDPFGHYFLVIRWSYILPTKHQTFQYNKQIPEMNLFFLKSEFTAHITLKGA